MWLLRWQFASDWNKGSFGNGGSFLDQSGNVSAFGHPSIAPTLSHGTVTASTGASMLAGTSSPVCALSPSNAWATLDVLGATAQAGDYVQFTTTSTYVVLTLTGFLGSGMGLHSGGTGLTSGALRNGGLAQVYIGPSVGALQLFTNLDCYNATPSVPINLSGASTVIRIQHSGNYNSAVNPITAVTPLVGTTVSNGLTILQSQTQKTLVAASWRVLATASGLFSLFKTPAGSTESLVAAGLTVGTVYDSAAQVPGVRLQLTGALTVNDSATFTTDQVMIGLLSMQVAAAGALAATNTWTSQIIDSQADPLQYGGPDAQWFLLEWGQGDWFQGHTPGQGGYQVAQVTLRTGNTPSPAQGIWSTYTTTPVQTVLAQSGTIIGQAGLQAAARGRYAQWTIQFPSGLSGPLPYMEDARLYWWVPERDQFFMQKISFGRGWTAGPILQAWLGTMSCDQADTYVNMLDLIADFAINTSTDQATLQYMADLGELRLGTEPITNLANRISLMLALRPQGGTIPTLAALMGIAVGGVAPLVTLAVGNGLLSASATSRALTTGPVTVSQQVSPDFVVTVPPSTTGGYPNLPGTPIALAQTYLTAFLGRIVPLTSNYTITFQ